MRDSENVSILRELMFLSGAWEGSSESSVALEEGYFVQGSFGGEHCEDVLFVLL